tara:strand:- start:4489 stop:4641 length:153 start_codon:yes stop_codon:yes gene_type:complete
LGKRYTKLIIDPEIKVMIAVFKSIRVLKKGELRNPFFTNSLPMHHVHLLI